MSEIRFVIMRRMSAGVQEKLIQRALFIEPSASTVKWRSQLMKNYLRHWHIYVM